MKSGRGQAACHLAYLKYIPIQKHHNDARDVEADQRWEYDEAGVEECAEVGRPVRRVVEAEHNRRTDRYRYDPHQQYRDEYA